MQILGIIPARFGSTRFPAKALANIQGKPMVQWVYENASKAQGLSDLIIATDHPLIEQAVAEFGGKVVMTKVEHPSGTDRAFEALVNYGQTADYVVNIQGDEPFIHHQQIDELIALLNGQTQLATLVKPITDSELLFSANTAKVVLNQWEEAIYFSRNPIPYLRNFPKEKWVEAHTYYKHIGIYAYRTDILEAITQLKQGTLEQAESLEQLRWIENGYTIRVGKTQYESLSVDTPEDLEKLIASRKLQ
jgi:3-deoxy-manno-octulosonate cytidylyltransferase (CMP-KDO synthetase)